MTRPTDCARAQLTVNRLRHDEIRRSSARKGPTAMPRALSRSVGRTVGRRCVSGSMVIAMGRYYIQETTVVNE